MFFRGLECLSISGSVSIMLLSFVMLLHISKDSFGSHLDGLAQLF